MKKEGILNGALSQTIAALGHTDKLVICDCGLPIPKGAKLIDLALTKNIPSFRDTLLAILNELEVEGAIIAEELEQSKDENYFLINNELKNIKVDTEPHEKFKELTRENGNIYFVRTGEATPYANIILISGVNF